MGSSLPPHPSRDGVALCQAQSNMLTKPFHLFPTLQPVCCKKHATRPALLAGEHRILALQAYRPNGAAAWAQLGPSRGGSS